jgi:hypothetical protein
MAEPIGTEECYFRCGYVSDGRDLLEHQQHEHAGCPDCGRTPVDRHTAVSHKQECPRLQPGYVYPDDVRSLMQGFATEDNDGRAGRLGRPPDARSRD